MGGGGGGYLRQKLDTVLISEKVFYPFRCKSPKSDFVLNQEKQRPAVLKRIRVSFNLIKTRRVSPVDNRTFTD